MSKTSFDAAVVGGGLVGAAVAWGLAREGLQVAMLDEGDVAYRASRGNFALVWVQGKGLGMGAYANWTVRSAERWPEFATALREVSGIDVAYERHGGFHIALSEAELEARRTALMRLHNQPEVVPYPYQLLERDALERELPEIGPEVAGASYTPLDGHANSLRLLRALHAGFQRLGGSYLPERIVATIEPLAGGGFRLTGREGQAIEAGKVVLAAGIGNARLAPMLGLAAPVRPQRGQVIVTEKTAPFLRHPTVTVRQTDEGGVMVGDSQEEAGLEDRIGPGILSTMADRAVRSFPRLARLNVVRTWVAFRVMTPDGFPIYDQSQSCPGAFLVTCHSGVTLAANHAGELARAIRDQRLPAVTQSFSARRFDVQQVA